MQSGSWADRLRSGDRRCIATAITAVENDTSLGREISGSIYDHAGSALVVGFTGAPGVGKSTLISACIRELRCQELSVGVVAVDPSSVFTGGAILGDRVRMHEHTGDDAVFIRSVASRGQLGGLSLSTARVIDVLDAAGKDVILVETVGTGQSEIEIAEIAHLNVVIVQPGTGDDIQTMKAGVLEIADILVVNKSDHPHADRCVTDLQQMNALRSGTTGDTPILKTVASSGQGVTELVDIIHKFHAVGTPRHTGSERLRHLLITEACNHLRRTLQNPDNPAVAAELDALSMQVLKADLKLGEAAEALLAVVNAKPQT